MPPSTRSFPVSFTPPAPAFGRDTVTSPLGGHPGSPTAARALVLSERDVLADLEPHWAATIDAATD